jgi:hypothetical protein
MKIRRSDGVMWHDKLTKFLYDRFRHLCSTKVNISNISEASVLVLLMEEMASGGMIYIPSFIHIQTHTQQGELISLLLFFQNKENRLKRDQQILKQ